MKKVLSFPSPPLPSCWVYSVHGLPFSMHLQTDIQHFATFFKMGSHYTQYSAACLSYVKKN